MITNRNALKILAGLIAALFLARPASQSAPPPDSTFSLAVCPLVYPLDESSERGIHYIFYGNAFFINHDGYLITAAHVLTDFRDGGLPSILLRRPNAPPTLSKVEVVAIDPQHDVAILRATPNPFAAKFQVAFLSLASDNPPRGAAILAEALRPAHLKNPHTFDASQEDQSPAEVLQYLSTKLDKGQPESQLFLFSHEVLRGQSGAPVISGDSHQVVGIIEGRWLHPSVPAAQTKTPAPTSGTPTLGAAIPINYALTLLQQNHITYNPPSTPAALQSSNAPF
jgi:S1-C subfamily serine protease